MLQCQAVNSWQETAPAAHPGKEGARAPVKVALVSGRGRELPLVSTYFQFLAPVPKLPVLSSSTSIRQTFIS